MSDSLSERLAKLEPGDPQKAFDLMRDFIRSGQLTEEVAEQIHRLALDGDEETTAEWQRLIVDLVVAPSDEG